MEGPIKLETNPMPIITPEKMFTTHKRYRFSKRLNQLAEPKNRPMGKEEIGKEILNMSNLVTYKETSSRILDLAKPRKIETILPKDLRRIPSRVLRANPTERTIQLSKPRVTVPAEEPQKKPISYKNCLAMVSRLSRPSKRYSAGRRRPTKIEKSRPKPEIVPEKSAPTAPASRDLKGGKKNVVPEKVIMRSSSTAELKKSLLKSFELSQKRNEEKEKKNTPTVNKKSSIKK